MNNKISVIIPVYKSPDSLIELHSRLVRTLYEITADYEIIFVNDASPLNDWEIINKIAQKDKNVKGINLSRNFGQHHAITAGLDYAQGEWIIVMDCDLQDMPEEIHKLYNEANINKCDAAIARRYDRQDIFIKRFSSLIFHKVLSFLTGVKLDNTVANFGIYNRKIVNSIKGMRESIRYFPTMVKWVGFNIKFIDVKHSKRKEGKTSYNFKRLFTLAIDIILAYSDKPLRLTIKFGFLMSSLSLLYAVYSIIKLMAGKITVPGYASIITSIWFLAGIIIMIFGVIGLYIGKTFEGVKNRPIYIITEKLNI